MGDSHSFLESATSLPSTRQKIPLPPEDHRQASSRLFDEAADISQADSVLSAALSLPHAIVDESRGSSAIWGFRGASSEAKVASVASESISRRLVEISKAELANEKLELLEAKVKSLAESKAQAEAARIDVENVCLRIRAQLGQLQREAARAAEQAAKDLSTVKAESDAQLSKFQEEAETQRLKAIEKVDRLKQELTEKDVRLAKAVALETRPITTQLSPSPPCALPCKFCAEYAELITESENEVKNLRHKLSTHVDSTEEVLKLESQLGELKSKLHSARAKNKQIDAIQKSLKALSERKGDAAFEALLLSIKNLVPDNPGVRYYTESEFKRQCEALQARQEYLRSDFDKSIRENRLEALQWKQRAEQAERKLIEVQQNEQLSRPGTPGFGAMVETAAQAALEERILAERGLMKENQRLEQEVKALKLRSTQPLTPVSPVNFSAGWNTTLPYGAAVPESVAHRIPPTPRQPPTSDPRLSPTFLRHFATLPIAGIISQVSAALAESIQSHSVDPLLNLEISLAVTFPKLAAAVKRGIDRIGKFAQNQTSFSTAFAEIRSALESALADPSFISKVLQSEILEACEMDEGLIAQVANDLELSKVKKWSGMSGVLERSGLDVLLPRVSEFPNVEVGRLFKRQKSEWVALLREVAPARAALMGACHRLAPDGFLAQRNFQDALNTAGLRSLAEQRGLLLAAFYRSDGGMVDWGRLVTDLAVVTRKARDDGLGRGS